MKLLIIKVRCLYNYRLSKGYTLLEVLLSIFIFGLILLPISNYLNNIILIDKNLKNKDKLMRESKFALSFIDYEIRNADRIYDVEEMVGYSKKFDDFGFLIELKDEEKENSSTYILYYIKNNILRRRALNRESNKCPNFSTIYSNIYTGDNIILENVSEIKVDYNKKISMISIYLDLNIDGIHYRSKQQRYLYNMGRY